MFLEKALEKSYIQFCALSAVHLSEMFICSLKIDYLKICTKYLLFRLEKSEAQVKAPSMRAVSASIWN